MQAAESEAFFSSSRAFFESPVKNVTVGKAVIIIPFKVVFLSNNMYEGQAC